MAEIAYISLQETAISLVAVVDDEKIGENFLGFEITNVKMIDTMVFDRILITSLDSREDVLEKILQRGFHRDKIVLLE